MQGTIAPAEEKTKRSNTISRRDFLKVSAAAAGLATLTACTKNPLQVPTPTPSPTGTPSPTSTRIPFRPSSLTDYQVQVLVAATARIIPTDDAPGAREAGVARFIDRALRQEDSARMGDYISGLGNLDIISEGKFRRPFLELSAEEQDEVLKAIESTPFFSTLRTHTIQGMFSDPIYGGNLDLVGWKLIQFSGAMFHPLMVGHIECGWRPMEIDYTSLLSRYGEINPYGQ